MKNIVFVHQSAELYGSDKTLLLYLKHYDKTKINPIVILPYDGPLKDALEEENIKVIIAPVLKLYRNIFTPKNIISFFKDIKKGFQRLDEINNNYKIDVIYSNTLAVLLGAFYAKKRNIKHIWHVHEIIVHPKIFANLFPILLRYFSDFIICNSTATKDNLTSRVESLTSKCVVVHNGLELKTTLDNTYTRDTLGFESDDIIITLVGRISRLKGHRWLLNTYLKYFKDKKIKLLFVGSPVDKQEYYLEEINQQLVEENILDKVKIISFTKKLSSIWAMTDIAIMPSTEAESFGLVAVEAMLANKPVIASNHGGLKEIVVNDFTGFLVTPNNETELADAITKLANNNELRKSFGENGSKRVINEFSVLKYVNNIESILLE